MAEQELQIEEGKKKSKLPLIIIAVVVLLGGGAAAYFLLFSGSDAPAEQAAEGGEGDSGAVSQQVVPAQTGSALYVAMPRPFVFNVPGTGRDRLVQIKVQLMMRGSDNEEMAKSHIPLIEGTLLQTFSASNADDLVTEAGKLALREDALTAVKQSLNEVTGSTVVEKVLFTGFVMQ